MFRIQIARNAHIFRHFRDFLPSGRRCSVSWTRKRWWLQCLKKVQTINDPKAVLYSSTSVCFSSGGFMVDTRSNEDIEKHHDLVKLMVVPFNLAEGGKYVVDILKKTNLSVTIIFVRSSVLAGELVKELNENNLNAILVDDSSQGISNQVENCVLVVSDKTSSNVTLPPADMAIQVQTPLSGIDVMKERLHVSNFTNPRATAMLLYNSNDSPLVAQLGQFTSISTIDSPLFHTPEAEEDSWLAINDKAKLPVIQKNFEESPAVSRKVKTSLFRPVYPQDRKSNRVGFVDRVRLYAIGGSGGNGSPRTGARGGDGGDVILECQSRATLRHFRFKENRRPKAEHGQHCCIRAKRVNGQRGRDLIVPVPSGTVVKEEATGRVLADMDEAGRKLRVACGGRGGSPSTVAGGGEKGERKMVILEYKMHTEVGLVGFPNAGKSTLLRALSNAKPKVAEYAFTSLSPTLGRVENKDFTQITVADLPGLLEGAHQNKGLGLKFLKHVERARLLLFVVDVNGFQLSSKHPRRTALEAVCLLAKELVSYEQELMHKPKILVVNKMDSAGAEKRFRAIKQELEHVTFPDKMLRMDDEFEDNDGEVAQHNPEPVKMLKDFRFDHVMAASALNRTGIEEIVCSLRKVMARSEDRSY